VVIATAGRGVGRPKDGTGGVPSVPPPIAVQIVITKVALVRTCSVLEADVRHVLALGHGGRRIGAFDGVFMDAVHLQLTVKIGLRRKRGHRTTTF